MDSVVHSALDEICCGAANGLYLRNLWLKLRPHLASQGLPLCPNVKRAVWENLREIPGLKIEACNGGASSSSAADLVKCTVEECEEMNVKIVAPESMRKSFLGIYEMEAPESSLSDVQRLILERLAMVRTNGIAQSELSRELRIPPNNLFYPLKRLETQKLILRQPTVIRKKHSSNREYSNDSVVATNMLYLYRFGKHLGSQQRLEITKEDKLLMDRESADDSDGENAKEDVHVKDFLPALKDICEKLEKAQGKVLVVSDIKQDLGYRGTAGHRAWRNICHKLKDARVVEECCTVIKKKEVNCLRLLQSFSPSHFEPRLRGHGHGHDDIDTEQSKNSLKIGQITELLVELPILRQIYDMVDAAGPKGLTNTEVCRRLGLCSKEYHKRYFKQMISRFGLHLQLENHNRSEVYRVWTAGNFNPESSNMAPVEGETVLKEVNESDPHIGDIISCRDLSHPVQAIGTSASMENVRGINESENNAAVTAEASSNGTNVDNGSSSILLLKCSQHDSDVELSSGVLDEELLQTSNSAGNNNLLETHSLAVVTPPPTPSTSRRRSNLRYTRLTMCGISSQREQYILKMLQEEKFLIKPDLHRRLENFENLEKEKHTTMDRKTLLRCLNKLQEEGHCKCIHVSVPGVTNCGRSRTIEVILHPSFQNVSSELLAQILDKMRSFETQMRQQSYTRQKKGQSVPVLDNVERIPSSVRSEIRSERAEMMRSNGFVLAKMVRTKLLHIFLWDRMRNSPDWDDALLSSNHSYDMKNPHSTCKLFELDLAIRSMPLALFLQVVGSPQKFEDMMDKCRSGLRLCDLPMEEYKALVDTLATGRLSWLADILRRLKLIRLVSKGHGEDGPSTILAHALELKPYIEEPVTVASAGHVLPDLRPQVRHDFVLSSRKAVDEYWKTLEYCYSAAKSRAALLAFPGTAVHEVFHPRSWASSRVMTAEERVELHKRVAKDNPNERLSFSECEKIAKDLNLTMEQVLRVYSVKRQQLLTRSQKDLNAESQEPRIVKDRHILSSCKRKRPSGGIPSKLVNDSATDGQSSLERVSPIYYADDNADGAELLNFNEEDKEDHTFIRKRALSNLNVSRRKKFLWTEEADRQLVIEYARRRAALGAKIHRVDWACISNLPAPPDTCKRRMAVLNGYMPFRKATMKLCNMLAERYTKYLEKCQDKMLDHGDPKKMINDPALGENNLKTSASMPGEWANFDEDIIKATLEDVLRYKRMTKLEAEHDTFPNQGNSEEDDYEGCNRTKASGQRSTRQPPVKHMKFTNDGGSVCRQMNESVAISNAAELLKLIFLSNSKAPEVPMLLAETLRRYSEHDLFAAFNYLRENKIMIGGSSNSPFVLSQYFMQSISLSTFPTDAGKKAANFVSWLHEREKDLMEEGIDVPSDLQCGEIFTLCALVSSGELSIAPCLPKEGVGEAEDNRVSKRKCDDNESDGGEISKKSKKVLAGDGEMSTRREKGFPGIKLCVHREKVSRLLAIESFKGRDMYMAPFFGGKDRGIPMDVICGTSHSDVADCVREMIDSGRTNHRVLDASESPWEAMASYAEYLMCSCSYEVNSSILHPNLFKNLYSAIQKSGDNGLSLKDIRKVLNIKDEEMLEVIIEVLEAFGRALKVNAYDSIQVVDSLYRSKYFLTSIHYHAGNFPKGQKRKFEDEHVLPNLDSRSEIVAPLEYEINMSADEVHRVTILNLPEDVSDPSTDISTMDKIVGHQNSDLASTKINIIENLGLLSVDSQLCRPLLPWMNGDGTINELVYKGLIRRVLGIVMQNPGILEDDIINQMHSLNPQSCKQLLKIMNMDNHVIARKMHQTTSSQPPSILGNLLGDRRRKSKLISRVHYFANPMSTTLL